MAKSELENGQPANKLFIYGKRSELRENAGASDSRLFSRAALA